MNCSVLYCTVPDLEVWTIYSSCNAPMYTQYMNI